MGRRRGGGGTVCYSSLSTADPYHRPESLYSLQLAFLQPQNIAPFPRESFDRLSAKFYLQNSHWFSALLNSIRFKPNPLILWGEEVKHSYSFHPPLSGSDSGLALIRIMTVEWSKWGSGSSIVSRDNPLSWEIILKLAPPPPPARLSKPACYPIVPPRDMIVRFWWSRIKVLIRSTAHHEIEFTHCFAGLFDENRLNFSENVRQCNIVLIPVYIPIGKPISQ